jgi:hypothetical protein
MRKRFPAVNKSNVRSKAVWGSRPAVQARRRQRTRRRSPVALNIVYWVYWRLLGRLLGTTHTASARSSVAALS